MNREALGTTLRLLNRERGAADTLPKKSLHKLLYRIDVKSARTRFGHRDSVLLVSLWYCLSSYALDCPLSQY